jgi:ankyrin repeat protein
MVYLYNQTSICFIMRSCYYSFCLFFFVALIFTSCNEGQKKSPENTAKGHENHAAPLSIRAPESNPQKEQMLRDAAFEGLENVVAQLINENTNVNSVDAEGRTALMLAAFNGYTSIAEKLIRAKADVNLSDQSGRTALMFASSGPFPETVQLLLDNNAETNKTDMEEHFTALMFAASEGQLDVVKLLLDKKADPFMKDIDGDDALSFARNNGHAEVVKVLEKLRK